MKLGGLISSSNALSETPLRHTLAHPSAPPPPHGHYIHAR